MSTMSNKRLIILLCLLVLSIPLGLYLEHSLEIKSAPLTLSILLGPVLIALGVFLRFLNYQIALSYKAIPGIDGGQLSIGRWLSKPRLSFKIQGFQCDLSYGDGNLYHRSATTLRVNIKAGNSLRVYPDDLALKCCRRIFSRIPVVEIGDDQFDKFFIAESLDADFVKAIISGDALIYTKKIMRLVNEIKIDDDQFCYSIGGIWPNKDDFRCLIKSVTACICNILAYKKGR
jgi:hypothetical protein